MFERIIVFLTPRNLRSMLLFTRLSGRLPICTTSRGVHSINTESRVLQCVVITPAITAVRVCDKAGHILAQQLRAITISRVGLWARNSLVEQLRVVRVSRICQHHIEHRRRCCTQLWATISDDVSCGNFRSLMASTYDTPHTRVKVHRIYRRSS
jgi:hypothetical protein